ncbi:MAG TPA: hypothetical protein VGR37_21045 [Longimicrobiaceae bacterium]|nr:hypothetical protein [Longimicrobiaceae bacterium]
MSGAIRALATGAVLAALCAAPAAAQTHSGSIGYGGGGIWFGSFGGASELKLEPGWVANLQADQWYWRGRVGARANVAFTQRPLRTGLDERQINTWFFDGSVLLRPVPPREGGSVAPYLSLGAGVVNYGFGRGRPVVLGDAVYPGSGERQLALVVGAGVDFVPRVVFLDTPLGLRLDFADHVTLESPFESRGGDAFGPVHNVRVMVGLIGLVGNR